jgi:DNA-binding XRE family transcriptional regulator
MMTGRKPFSKEAYVLAVLQNAALSYEEGTLNLRLDLRRSNFTNPALRSRSLRRDPNRRRDHRRPDCIVFGDALARLREKTGRMQYEVASAAKLTRTMLSAYEKGKAYPSVPSLRALLHALGADFCDLQRSIDAGSQPGSEAP